MAKTRQIIINNHIYTYSDLAKLTGLSKETISLRYNKGLRGKDLIKPIRKKKYQFKGKMYTSLAQIAKDYKVNPVTVTRRYKKGIRDDRLVAKGKIINGKELKKPHNIALRNKDAYPGLHIGYVILQSHTKVWNEKMHCNQDAWLCQCICGNLVKVPTCRLRPGVSCGCKSIYHKYANSDSNNPKYHKLYKAWSAINSRCYTKSDQNYKNYGGRGIKVCAEWNKYNDNGYINFKNWMLNQNYDLNKTGIQQTIDRIDNNYNYCPENCRLVSMSVQQNNKRTNKYVYYKGKKMTYTQLSRLLNLNPDLVYYRLNHGASINELSLSYKDYIVAQQFKNPNSPSHSYLITQALRHLSEKYGIKFKTIKNRWYHGVRGNNLIQQVSYKK